jgi:anti-anti-sigma factor
MSPDSDGTYQIREAGFTIASSASPADTAEPITISDTRHPSGTLTVTVIGDLDFSTAATFHRRLYALLDCQHGGVLELNFSRLDFCDLAGWRAIHAVAQAAAKMRYRTRITAAAPCLDAVLQLCHIPVFLGYTPPQKAF